MLTIIGDIGYDLLWINGALKKNLGGSGYHTLIGAVAAEKKIPILVACVGGDFAVADIAKWGASTEHIKRIENEKTTRFLIRYDGDARDVAFEMGASGKLCLDRLDDAVKSSDIVHLAATDPERQMQYIEELRRTGYRGRLSVDVFDQFCRDKADRTRQVLEKCDILFMSEVERQLLHYRHDAAEKLFVLKKAEKGAECFWQGGHVIAACPRIEAVADTTGAGDILAGAFLSLIDAGEEIEAAIHAAVALATSSVRFPGSDEFCSALKERCLSHKTQCFTGK